MENAFDFDDLVILDLANNHQGSVDHGKAIIRECAEVLKRHGIRGTVKFQFRNLDSFVHIAHRKSSDNKHVGRFLSTALDREQFEELVQAVRDEGLLTTSTPFDEASVDFIDELDLDIVKIASCSARDWPLLEKVATYNRPVIVSTGGLDIEDIDNLASFFEHRRVHHAFMHCVSIYPTPPEDLHLLQIRRLAERYPGITIGFSTHESPDSLSPVQIAHALGARMFERHVGLSTETIDLNAYSSTPDQVDRWLSALNEAKAMEGSWERRPSPEIESSSIAALQRGVFVNRPVTKGEELGSDDIYFAFPIREGQLESGSFKPGVVLEEDLDIDQPVMLNDCILPDPPPNRILFRAIHRLKAMLNEARIALPTDFELEFSHHHGLDRFFETGATIINCINREYCKKLILMLPGQRHPNHYHKRKEETFQVLHGILRSDLEGRERILYPGDTIVIPQGAWHSSWSDEGTIFEEISTTHHNDDSFYEDKSINTLERVARKTTVKQWGRYQL